jgi:hypothetical protein
VTSPTGPMPALIAGCIGINLLRDETKRQVLVASAGRVS